jgi:tyrosyl-tRNA synthetase
MTSKSLQRAIERQLAVMRDGSVDFYGEQELRGRLAEALAHDRPLRVKLGMDPSAPDLHLGHCVVLQKLGRLQELGHTPIFLIGDFTGRIGDPSGRNKTRPALEPEEIEKNAATYVEQVSLVLDTERAEVRFNSEWMESMSSADLVRLCSRYTVARLLERDDFARRYAAGEAISVHEFLYPFVQAYDSVALHSDIELGGTDQTFNLLMAREIQRDYGQLPQAVITHPLLVGTDGREKMSKSLGNTIDINAPPEDIYGKIMSISDARMLEYFDLLRGGAWTELCEERAALGRGEGDPLSFKQGLAFHTVQRFAGEDAARRAAERFRRVIQRREVPADLPERAIELGEAGELGLLELLTRLGFTKSHSEARRLVEQGAVEIDGESARDARRRLGAGSYLIRAGKRRLARLRLG